MELMEAKGYLQAVADNWNDAPKAQKAIQTVLDYVDDCYEEQNRLIGEIARLHRALDTKHRDAESLKQELEVLNTNLKNVSADYRELKAKNEALKQELEDERYRHDRYVDYSVGQDAVIDALRAELASMRTRCQKLLEENKRLYDRVECLLTR